MESKFNAYTNGQLKFMLSASEYSNWDKILVADLLLQRREALIGLNVRYEKLFSFLSKSELLKIEREDFAFAPATVHAAILEMKKRQIKPLSWFAASNSTKHGPFDRMELDHFLEDQAANEMLIWREGMKEWKKLSNIPHLNQKYFFDQKHNYSRQEQQVPPENDFDSASPESTQSQTYHRPVSTQQTSSSKGTSASLIILGLFQFIGFPFWLIMIIIAFFSGFNSMTGPILPVMFSIVMLVLSIPLGIGIIGAKNWAYQIRLATGAISIIWFAFRYFGDDASVVWMFLAIYDAVLLAILLSNSDKFRE